MPVPPWIVAFWLGPTITAAPWPTVVDTLFEVLGFCVFPRSSWNEMLALLLMTTPAVVPLFTVTVNCTDPEPPAAMPPRFHVTTTPVRTPPPVALTKVVCDGTTSVMETLVAAPVPVFE